VKPNYAFGVNKDELAIKRFMDTSVKTQKVYLFNPADAKMMADKALRDNLLMKVNFVHTKSGPVPWTRTISMSEENALIRNKESLSSLAKSDDGESMVAQGDKQILDQMETTENMSPNQFLNTFVYNQEQEQSYGPAM